MVKLLIVTVICQMFSSKAIKEPLVTKMPSGTTSIIACSINGPQLAAVVQLFSRLHRLLHVKQQTIGNCVMEAKAKLLLSSSLVTTTKHLFSEFTAYIVPSDVHAEQKAYERPKFRPDKGSYCGYVGTCFIESWLLELESVSGMKLKNKARFACLGRENVNYRPSQTGRDSAKQRDFFEFLNFKKQKNFILS